ncbi:MAG TPA: biotin--[acetyl-CoA-carboxylase] ligase [Polyangiaceae bacterium]|jgi:BirA family biotin operon repressor/biotin-[acetyl-CoA-carboxylase] ligase|nr:biotin--[acetyl-CoA-carboxylase] ligase [Polyangiaceae bacterium]
MSAAFDAERFAALAAPLRFGRPLVVKAVTGSTNDDALEAARAGAPEGALFVTEAQERGRGRRGNVWHASPGEALLFSLVLRPSLAVERAPVLALVAGLAVRAALAVTLKSADVASEPRVKWPNDVVVGHKKVAGILVESQVRGETLGAVVVGVGLNVGRSELPAEVAAHATSLAALGATVSREVLLAGILRALEERLPLVPPLDALTGSRELPLTTLMVEELIAFDALRGAKVSVGDLKGVATGLDTRGNLRLLDANGAAHEVTSGHVIVESWGAT